jgi:dTDP-4-amino-4,6-dideoxygalactose transaminase
LGHGKRDALRAKLARDGIQTEVYYPRALHEQECFQTGPQSFFAAQKLTQETLAMPLSDDTWIPKFS